MSTSQALSHQALRELKPGKTITVTTEDGRAAIKLLAVAGTTSIGHVKADTGKQFVVYSMQVKNLGQTEWDTSWLESPRWSGADGEAVSPVFVAGPTDAKLVPYRPFSSTPEPRSGEHIRATEILGVPNTFGTLQFEDGDTEFNVRVER
ncbi:hypothetical protein OG302_00685 [Streptomyces sp. NBC_01283]|uniref:hypothetical protein n=1 Tax=Streptomyces sp. NBC_01283 TaxID=2903812 RepID=UPI00352DA334|nr:hypothetical protein OG302_00685 [Streptomyces sp. NBC_01283]